MRIIFLLFSILFCSGTALAAESPQDVFKKLQNAFPCKGINETHCVDDEEFATPEIYNLRKGYKLIALYDKIASGTMSLYETYLQDKNGKFYYLDQGAGVCVDGKNLLLINLGHCSAEETTFDIEKIDLVKKRLINIKTMQCAKRPMINKYMQDNFPNSVSYNNYGKCDFSFGEKE